MSWSSICTYIPLLLGRHKFFVFELLSVNNADNDFYTMLYHTHENVDLPMKVMGDSKHWLHVTNTEYLV